KPCSSGPLDRLDELLGGVQQGLQPRGFRLQNFLVRVPHLLTDHGLQRGVGVLSTLLLIQISLTLSECHYGVDLLGMAEALTTLPTIGVEPRPLSGMSD